MAYSIQNPEYLELNSADKATLKFSALLHDIAKKEFVVDSGHQYLSSEYVKSIGSKIFSHPRAQERVCEFVCNHHWLADYSNDVRGFSPTEVAIRFRRPNDFKMAKIMSKADLMAVSPEFYNRLKEALSDEKLKYIQDNIDNVKDIIKGALAEIPHTSRLFEDVSTVIEWYDSGLSSDECYAKICEKWNDHFFRFYHAK